MSKNKKIILGIATIWPLVYAALFILFVFLELFLSFFIGIPDILPTGFFLLLPLHLLTIASTFILFIFYIINVFKNERITQDNKILWVLILLIGNIIAMVIYWYFYIWKEPKQQITEQKT